MDLLIFFTTQTTVSARFVPSHFAAVATTFVVQWQNGNGPIFYLLTMIAKTAEQNVCNDLSATHPPLELIGLALTASL